MTLIKCGMFVRCAIDDEKYSRDYITRYYSVDGFKKNVKEEIIKCQK